MQGAPVCQKLGMISENKVVQRLELERNVFYKKWSPKIENVTILLSFITKYKY